MTGTAPTNVPASQSTALPTLSVIVPTFRDGSRIYANLRRLDHALSDIGEPYEIIVVSDGNVDNTCDETRRLGKPNVRLCHYSRNMGKGFALRHGVTRSVGQVVTFIDGDGDIDPVQIAAYLRLMRETGADIVVGSKRHPASDVVYPLARRLYSTTYQGLLRVLFRLSVRDTQVGLKLFRREVLTAVLPRIVVKRYAFDLELLVVAHHLGFTRVVEAPVRISQRFSSTINARAIASILWETLAIYYRRNVLRYYDFHHAPVAPNEADLEARAAEEIEARRIARNVGSWLAAGLLSGIGSCYTGIRARLERTAMGSLDGVDGATGEGEWRASV